MDKGLKKDIRIGFIGAGKVGFTLGKFFGSKGIRVTGYYSRHAESAKEAATFTDSAFYEKLSDIVKVSDALFLTVPDGEIAGVFHEIKDLDICNKYICHCSGALSAKEAFVGIESTKATGYSIHPLFPISSKYDCYKELTDAFFCVEGNQSGIDEIIDLLTGIGLKARKITSENKVKYHSACVFASNLVCGVMAESLKLLEECGFEGADALQAISPLVKSNINHILDEGPVLALTGPIERADITTIKKHMDVLDGESLEMYKALSKRVLECAIEKNPSYNYQELKNLLLDS